MIYINLKDLIESKGISQKQLHEESGVREATIIDMCHNRCKMLGVHNLNRLCAYFNCRIEDILEYIPDDEI